MREHWLFHEADQDEGVLCPSAEPLGARDEREHQTACYGNSFPKARGFICCLAQEIKRVQAMLTIRPRKVLNWHSPAHAFHQLLH